MSDDDVEDSRPDDENDWSGTGWLIFDLTIVSFGAAIVHAFYYSGGAEAQLPLAPEPHWGLWLRYVIYLPMGLITFAAPFLAIAALWFGKWQRVALGLLWATALFQGGALWLEYNWKLQERFNAVEKRLESGS